VDTLPEAVLAVYRMPTGAAVADNFDLGAIAAPIDLATGRLGAGVQKLGDHAANAVATHPDTGARIAGHVLPDWARALDLARRAHRALPSPRTTAAIIGWDVVLTPAGPVLLECNAIPGVFLAQMPTGIPLGDTAYAAALVARLRATFL
jgi:hypothetical protein